MDDAASACKEILEWNPKNEYAKTILKQIEIDRLSKKAYDFHVNKKYTEAEQAYNQIIAIDSTNKWAIENMKRLSTEP